MGLRSTQGNEKRLLFPSSPTALLQQMLLMEAPSSPLSSRGPKRSDCLDCQGFVSGHDFSRAIKAQSLCALVARLKSCPDTKRNRGRDLRFSGPLVEMFFDRAQPDFLPRSAGQGRVCAFPQRKAHEVCQRHQVSQGNPGERSPGICGPNNIAEINPTVPNEPWKLYGYRRRITFSCEDDCARIKP
jgi:hypothetical protein